MVSSLLFPLSNPPFVRFSAFESEWLMRGAKEVEPRGEEKKVLQIPRKILPLSNLLSRLGSVEGGEILICTQILSPKCLSNFSGTA